IARILNWSHAQLHPSRHAPPASFVRGQAIEITAAPFGAGRRRIVLHYRHVNQSEPWQSIDMIWGSGEFSANIPGEYTNSFYPIIYYFEIFDHDVSGFYPGIVDNLSNTPYFLMVSRDDVQRPKGWGINAEREEAR